MFVRMVWGKLRPGTWNEYESHYRENVIGKANNVTGLISRQLLRGTEDPDEGISLTTWDTLEHLLESERGETRGRLAKEVEHLYRGEYSVSHYEVDDSVSWLSRDE